MVIIEFSPTSKKIGWRKAVYDSFHGPPPSSDRAIKMTDGSVAPVLYQNGFGRLLVEVLKFAGLASSPSALSYVAGFQEPWPEKVSALSSLFGRGLEDIPLHPITLLTILGFCLDVGTRKWILQRSGVPRDAHRKAVRILEMARQSLEGRRLCLCDPVYQLKRVSSGAFKGLWCRRQRKLGTSFVGWTGTRDFGSSVQLNQWVLS
jgi:hypothetical protein